MKPRHVEFCPSDCPHLVLKDKHTDRCRKGYWRNSDPFKKGVLYAQYELQGGRHVLIFISAVRPKECGGGNK